MRINKDLMRSLGLGLLSAQTGPSRTPITGWQTFGKGLASGFDRYNKVQERQAEIARQEEEQKMRKQKYMSAQNQLKYRESFLNQLAKTNPDMAMAIRGGMSYGDARQMYGKQQNRAIKNLQLYEAGDDNAYYGRPVIGEDGKVKIERVGEMFKKSTRPGVTVQMPEGPRPITELDKKIAEGNAKFYEAVNEKASEANAQQQKLDFLERTLANQKTGRGMPTLRELQGVANTFGIQIGSLEGLSSYEASESIVAELALRARNPESGLGLTGNTSKQDLAFLRSLPPSAGKTPEANALLFMSYRKVGERKNKIAEAVNRLAADGKLSHEDRTEIRAIEREPMFSEEDWNELERVRAGDSGVSDQQASQGDPESPSNTEAQLTNAIPPNIRGLVDLYAPQSRVNMDEWNRN